MNPDTPSSQPPDREVELTALLLGELPADRAFALGRAIEQDPELAKTYARLQRTIELVRTAQTETTAEPRAAAAEPRLGDQRRQELLQHFKTVRPREFAKPGPQSNWLLQAAVAVVIISLMSAVLLPTLSRSKSKARRVLARLNQKEPNHAVADYDDHIVTPETLEAKTFTTTFTTNAPVPPAESRPKDSTIILPGAESAANFAVPLTAPVVASGSAKVVDPNSGPVTTPAALTPPLTTSTPAPAKPGLELPSVSGNAGALADASHLVYGGLFAGDSTNGRAVRTDGDQVPAFDSLGFGRGIGGGVTRNPGSVVSAGSTVTLFNREREEAVTRGIDKAGKPLELNEPAMRLTDGTVEQLATLNKDLGIATNGVWIGELGRNTTSVQLGLEVELPPSSNALAFSYFQLPNPNWNVDGLGESAGELSKEILPARDGRKKEASSSIVLPQTPLPALAPEDKGGRAWVAQTDEPPTRSLRLPSETTPPSKSVVAAQDLEKAAEAKKQPLINDMVQRQKETTPGQLALSKQYGNKLAEAGELKGKSETIDSNSTSEKMDAGLPKTSMVQILDTATAEGAGKPGVVERLRRAVGGTIERHARVKAQHTENDIAGLSKGYSDRSYDPYFLQNEFEVVQSDAVLGKVVQQLKLGDEIKDSKSSAPKASADAIRQLRNKLVLRAEPGTELFDIGVKSSDPAEAAKLANAVAEAYVQVQLENKREVAQRGAEPQKQPFGEQQQKTEVARHEVEMLRQQVRAAQPDAPAARPPAPALVPQPQISTRDNTFSTFSLNVSDVSWKLAMASLEKGVLPDPGSVRTEEFINAFDYRDPEPAPGAPLAFAWDRARYPFAQNRDLLRLAIKTAAQGRQPGRPLNLVLLLDNSGSMERADRVAIIHEALRILASQLQPQDMLSVVTFSREPRLVVDGAPGNQAGQVVEQLSGLTPEGGTNLELAMNLAYQTALRHYLASGVNRVVLLTDGAANLGEVNPDSLKQKVESNRKQGIALDCFGIGWEDYNDELLENLSRNGDGRYGFINAPEQAATEFASQLAGALQVAAADVKVQVEFNPQRVTSFRQLGYAKHQLTKEQFRDNSVDAAEIGAAESGNALYVIEVNPNGTGPLATVRVRYKVPGTQDYKEHEWPIPYNGSAPALEHAPAAMRLAASASAFSEWLASSPYAAEISPDALLGYLNGVPDQYGADQRPKKLEWMIRQAKSISGK